jgi:hypothetical protein
MAGLGVGVSLALVLLGLLIAVLWVLLPFAVFGVKDLMRQLLAEQRKTNALLEQARPDARTPSGQTLASG